MASEASKFVAGGAITVSSIVKHSATADQTVLQCGLNGRPFGISQTGTKDPPGVTGSGTGAASADLDMIMVFLNGQRAPLRAGSGGWSANDLIGSDASGDGINVTTATGQQVKWVAGIAEEACAAGEIGYVRVCIMPFYPTVS